MTTFSLLAARLRGLCSIALLSLCLADMSVAQERAIRQPRDLPGQDLVVQLEPRMGSDGPRWSPKGVKIALEPSAEGLVGSFDLGPEEEQARSRLIRVRLSRSGPEALSHDRLSIDLDRDGDFSADEIQAARQKGDRAAATQKLERLLTLDPKNGNALLVLGILHREQGDLDLAVASFRKAQAAAVEPGARGVAMMHEALALVEQKHHAEARMVMRRALRLHDGDDVHRFLDQLDRVLDRGVAPVAEVDVKPAPVQLAPPAPTEALRQRPPAIAEVAFIVDIDGTVRDVYITGSTDDAFDDAILDAVKQWRFEPGRRGGDAVPVRMRMPVRVIAAGGGRTPRPPASSRHRPRRPGRGDVRLERPGMDPTSTRRRASVRA